MWIKDGQLYSAGSPQYGQLGHGSTHEYNTKDSSVKMAFEPQPTPNPIQAFAGKKVTKARAEAIRPCALPFPRRAVLRARNTRSHMSTCVRARRVWSHIGALRWFAHSVGGAPGMLRSKSHDCRRQPRLGVHLGLWCARPCGPVACNRHGTHSCHSPFPWPLPPCKAEHVWHSSGGSVRSR